MRWISRTALTIICLLGLLALGGAIYQSIAMRMDARRSPEPGTLVDIGGYNLEIYCTGGGSPTVILESGLGDLLPEWERVQTGITKFSRVCSYDRAGYGGSDAGPMPRTSALIATELHTLLQKAGEKPPFVLVGHSFGGYNTRVFNGDYPKEVAGLVLVDSPQEDEYEKFPPAWQSFSAALSQHYNKQATVAPFFVGLGIARLMLQAQGGLGRDGYLILQAKYLKARASELGSIRTSAEQARAAGGLADKPLIVLAAGTTLGAAPIDGLTQDGVVAFQRMWIEDLQPRLARLSTRGKLVVLPNSGHNIPAERPDAVVEAVRQICTAVGTQ
jgi:pimeloyl-ACP methyl ester carboxylesterase